MAKNPVRTPDVKTPFYRPLFAECTGPRSGPHKHIPFNSVPDHIRPVMQAEEWAEVNQTNKLVRSPMLDAIVQRVEACFCSAADIKFAAPVGHPIHGLPHADVESALVWLAHQCQCHKRTYAGRFIAYRDSKFRSVLVRDVEQPDLSGPDSPIHKARTTTLTNTNTLREQCVRDFARFLGSQWKAAAQEFLGLEDASDDKPEPKAEGINPILTGMRDIHTAALRRRLAVLESQNAALSARLHASKVAREESHRQNRRLAVNLASALRVVTPRLEMPERVFNALHAALENFISGFDLEPADTDEVPRS